MPRMLARLTALGVALTVLAAACTGTGGGTAQVSPSATPSPRAAARPKFELATYQYAIQTKGKIRVGTRDDNGPFGLKDPTTKRYDGFDIDVAREIAKAIFGSEAETDPDRFIDYVPVVSATRISSLTDTKADVIAATFTISDEGRKQIDFTSEYFRTGQRILVKESETAIKDVKDLSEKTVCTVKGSPSADNIVKQNKDAKLLLLDAYPPCLRALQQGAADAVSTDETILFELVRQDPNTRIVGPYLSDVAAGIGVAKGRVGFVPFLNKVIADMIADGRWAALYKRWITPLSGDVKDGPHDRGRPA